jgi:hypothetical protein
MVQVLEDFSPQSQRFAGLSRFSQGVGQGAERLKGHLDERSTRNALAEQFGEQFKNVRDPRIQQLMLQNEYEKKRTENQNQFNREKFAHEEKITNLRDQAKAQQETNKLKNADSEKLNNLESGLETIARMKEIGQGNRLGIGSKLRSFVSPKTQKDRAEYEQLGKSLISLASNIPIRNQREFETLAGDLYNPDLSDSAREGILEAMEQIISQSLKKFSNEEEADLITLYDPEGNELEVPPDEVDRLIELGARRG